MTNKSTKKFTNASTNASYKIYLRCTEKHIDTAKI